MRAPRSSPRRLPLRLHCRGVRRQGRLEFDGLGEVTPAILAQITLQHDNHLDLASYDIILIVGYNIDKVRSGYPLAGFEVPRPDPASLGWIRRPDPAAQGQIRLQMKKEKEEKKKKKERKKANLWICREGRGGGAWFDRLGTHRD